MGIMPADGRLFATSDLHVAHRDNRHLVERLEGEHERDWLVVAGDVAERLEDVRWALRRLRTMFGAVVWAPGNHELWTSPRQRGDLRGAARYRRVVEICRELGVYTPEDPYQVWRGPGGPLVVAPLFLLYDYSLRPDGTTKQTALAAAWEAGVVCTDEFLLHPDPYVSREAWCAARLAVSAFRLDRIPDGMRTLLVSHWPLHPAPTRVLRRPEFALWCGSALTADWHLRYRAAIAIYGHLHIPRSTEYDGVRFEEVSLGYPQEWRGRGAPPPVIRQILPAV
jgi:3',5'-cyclic AMP phosphodiesterase CpdA